MVIKGLNLRDIIIHPEKGWAPEYIEFFHNYMAIRKQMTMNRGGSFIVNACNNYVNHYLDFTIKSILLNNSSLDDDSITIESRVIESSGVIYYDYLLHFCAYASIKASQKDLNFLKLKFGRDIICNVLYSWSISYSDRPSEINDISQEGIIANCR